MIIKNPEIRDEFLIHEIHLTCPICRNGLAYNGEKKGKDTFFCIQCDAKISVKKKEVNERIIAKEAIEHYPWMVGK